MGRADQAQQVARLRKQLASTEPAVDRLRAVRALWIGAQVTQAPGDKVAQEFFYAVGDVLEGAPIEKVANNLKTINGYEVLQEINDNT